MLRVTNTQTRTKEEFAPLAECGRRVRIYCCGPTVYDSLHLGHARAAITPDVIRRYLEYSGYQVRYVTNFTDVDDKIVKRSIREGWDWREIAATYIDEYHRLMAALNVKPADAYPRATEHIAEMIEIVEVLLVRKHAYIARDGDVYFDTASFARYGALSGRKLEEEEAGLSGRIDAQRLAVKRNSGDFVLWKLNKNDPDELKNAGMAVPRWPSPWGEGRPGWHLECSAMSQMYLGVPFDIHCGGMDLVFPHHEDEKAQTECAFHDLLEGAESVKYWLHNAFVTVKSRPEDEKLSADLLDAASGSVKMSKSLGNVKWLREMIWPDGPYDPMAVRMMLLSSHYRSPIVFEPAMLDEATARLERLYNALDALDRATHPDGRQHDHLSWKMSSTTLVKLGDPAFETQTIPLVKAIFEAETTFKASMDDDFNTAGALASIFDLVTEANQELARRRKEGDCSAADRTAFRSAAHTIRTLMETLGLRPIRAQSAAHGGDTQRLLDLLLALRQDARKEKQFKMADGIRDGLAGLGYEIEDLPGGKSIVKKKR